MTKSGGFALGVQSASNTNGQVSVIGSTLDGNISVPSSVGMVFSDGATWNAGEVSNFGGDTSAGVWEAPLTMLSFAADDIDTDAGQAAKTVQFGVANSASASPVNLAFDRFKEPGQVALLAGSTLNPGGKGRFMTSTIHMGSTTPKLWLASGSTLEMDIGDDNGIVKHDKLVINPTKPDAGSIVSGGAEQGGGYNVKINLLGLKGLMGRELSLAEANVVMADGKLVQPLAANGVLYKSSTSGRESLVYRLDSVRFDREQMSGFARSIARQMDEALAQGNYKKESSMVAALGYYAGDESVYEEQLAELAENGTVLDVKARRIRALALQNNLHSCLVFVGDGLGLVEQNCTYARVTGSDLSLSGASGSDSDQTVTGSQIAIGGQRQIGEGLFAGLMFGVGQANANSNDSEYRSNSSR